MDEDLYSDQELGAIEYIKGAIYGGSASLAVLRQTVAPFPAERRGKILEGALIEISAEQAQRRRFVAGSITVSGQGLGDSYLDETLTKIYGQNNGDIALTINNMPDFKNKITAPADQTRILEEAKIFSKTDEYIESLMTELLRIQKVSPYFNLLNALSSNQLSLLINQISDYISQAERGRAEEVGYNPDLPKSLTSLLAGAKMSLSLGSLASLSSKIHFLMTVLYISQAIVQNRVGSKLGDEQLQSSIAKFLYLEGSSPNLDL